MYVSLCMYVSMYDDVIYLNFLLALGAFVFVKIMAAQPVQRTRSNDDVFMPVMLAW